MSSTLAEPPPAAPQIAVQRERTTPAFDLLRVPLLGPALRWRYSRIALQTPLALVAIVMILHSFFGPQLAPKNLGVLLTWVHFRGLVVVTILLAGNLFCMACPFMLPRDLARRWFTPRWEWPRALRNKWPAIVLFALVLYAYELFDLWGDPWWTGVLIVGYFAAAFGIDMLFRRASFCKYVCPIGQFNFLSSALSPLEVAVRDQEICADCQTKDCIRGVRQSSTVDDGTRPNDPLPIVQRGCELALFQPRKAGNLDCTFCMDCIYACPHDNVGVVSRLPAEKLAASGPRSGLGAIERRFDFTALITLFTFGAILNAFAMTSPVYALEQGIADLTGLRVEWPILAGLFAVVLVLEPLVLLGAAAAISKTVAGARDSLMTIANRFARSLVPIGFGMWLAHYAFHFFTGFLTVIPVAQNAARETFGHPILGEPSWQLGGLPESIVLPMELGFLGLGLVGSWAVAWLIAREWQPQRVGRTFAPWATLHLLLFVSGVWIMLQPMDMRGTFLGG